MHLFNMTYREQQHRLNIIKNAIVKKLCANNSMLLDTYISVGNCNHDILGHFNTLQPDMIEISSDFIEELSKSSIQNEFYQVAAVILHELIHRYNYLNNIDDTDHGENFTKTAKQFGYIAKYENNTPLEEYISLWAWLEIKNYMYKY